MAHIYLKNRSKLTEEINSIVPLDMQISINGTIRGGYSFFVYTDRASLQIFLVGECSYNLLGYFILFIILHYNNILLQKQ